MGHIPLLILVTAMIKFVSQWISIVLSWIGVGLMCDSSWQYHKNFTLTKYYTTTEFQWGSTPTQTNLPVVDTQAIAACHLLLVWATPHHQSQSQRLSVCLTPSGPLTGLHCRAVSTLGFPCNIPLVSIACISGGDFETWHNRRMLIKEVVISRRSCTKK